MSARVIGNPAGLPWHPRYLPGDVDGARYRIYKLDDDGSTDDEIPYLWQVDDCGVIDGLFAVGEWAINFPTHAEAVAWVRDALAGLVAP